MLIPKYKKQDDIDSDFSDEHDIMEMESDIPQSARMQRHSMGMDKEAINKLHKFTNLETVTPKRTSEFDFLERKDFSQIRER